MVVLVSLAAVMAPTGLAVAQEGHGTGTFDAATLLFGVLSTVTYAVVGIVLAIGGYQLFARMLPFDVKKELEEDQNIAVGILLAALIIGICIIVAATIQS